MTNRRLTISALAVMLMTGCSADTTVNPEILDLVGTWEVQTFIYTSLADPLITQDDLVAPLEATVMYIVFYDDNDVIFVTHYADTLDATTGAALGVESDFDGESWCVELAEDDHEDHDHVVLDCVDAGPGDIIFDEGGADELFATFARNGDNMTISSTDPTITYEFDPLVGDEPAIFTLTMQRIILEIERPDLTCAGKCLLGT